MIWWLITHTLEINKKYVIDYPISCVLCFPCHIIAEPLNDQYTYFPFLIADLLLECIGCEKWMQQSTSEHKKLLYHCLQFGFYARYLLILFVYVARVRA